MEYTVPRDVKGVAALLQPLDDFWDHWGFEPWEEGPFSGVCRLQRFVKDGFLGTIAEYRAWDCIVLHSGTAADRENFWNALRPMEDVMTQRFVFLVQEPWTTRRIRSFWFGLKGYVEFYSYRPTQDGGEGASGIKDLTDLIDMGIRLSLTGRADPNGRA